MKKVDQPLRIEMVPIHRREDCEHYEICLEEASALMWQSFSCKGCQFFALRAAPPPSYEKSASPLAWEI